MIKKEDTAHAGYQQIADAARAAIAQLEAETDALSAPHDSVRPGRSIPPPPPVDRRGRNRDDGNMDARIANLEKDLAAVKTDVAVMRSNYVTRADLASMETTILKWFVATTFTLTALAFAAAKFVH